MRDFEKLGVFYLGRVYDPRLRQSTGELILYDSKDLVTHAVCVGMTGSGKTGLCLSLLEEAAIDGIPAIAVDPKGDLGNLLLTFPELRGEDFAPWINAEDAAKKGLPPREYAEQQAKLWRDGLAAWGQGPERVRRLRESVDMAVYTPGSSAGLPVSILRTFSRPEQEILDDPELLRERIGTTVSGLLGLLGIQTDPLRSREHILIAGILDKTWREGRDLDLASLIGAVQAPPMERIGVLDMETFFPSKERFDLVVALNNLLASPGFAAWMEGEPLDIARLLHTVSGKPRISIISIAHLNDNERMFFVSLLLNQVLGWVRRQSGTTSLRAILYLDEMFGFFPPVANPPSKQPLMTLVKQARAFGLGVVLATQNPVDLDYKGLSNAGTWLIGRLQTERDKARVLEGLEGAAAAAGSPFDRARMDVILSGLGSRVFLMNNVHEDEPVVFESRWAMSYLRGPLTRTQIKTLMDPLKEASAGTVSGPAAAAPREAQAAAASARPSLPPDVPQYFLPVRGAAGQAVVYRPMIYAAAKARFADAKLGADLTRDLAFLAPITDAAIPVSWEGAAETFVPPTDLEKEPAPGAGFAPLPAAAGKARQYEQWSKDCAAWLYGSLKLDMLRHPASGLVSRPGESEGDFLIRLRQSGRESRDEAAERLRQKYAPKIAALEERIRRAEQAVEREQLQARSSQMQTAISLGATILGAFIGRKKVNYSTLGRATTTARGVGRAMKEQQDIGRARETVEALRRQLADLEAEFQEQSGGLEAEAAARAVALENLSLKPRKTDIGVSLTALAWAPYRRDASGVETPVF